MAARHLRRNADTRHLGFPPEQLAANEDVVLNLKPHWIAYIKPTAQTALIAVGLAVTWWFLPLSWGDWPYAAALVVAVVLLAVFPVRPLVVLLTTHIVVTTQRVIRKSGWVGIHWVEISLEKINDVHYTQNAFERMARAGDVSIESAGRAGQEVFDDLPDPARIQRVLTELKGKRSEGPTQTSVADELSKLQRLQAEGVLTEDEFTLVKRRLLART